MILLPQNSASEEKLPVLKSKYHQWPGYFFCMQWSSPQLFPPLWRITNELNFITWKLSSFSVTSRLLSALHCFNRGIKTVCVIFFFFFNFGTFHLLLLNSWNSCSFTARVQAALEWKMAVCMTRNNLRKRKCRGRRNFNQKCHKNCFSWGKLNRDPFWYCRLDGPRGRGIRSIWSPKESIPHLWKLDRFSVSCHWGHNPPIKLHSSALVMQEKIRPLLCQATRKPEIWSWNN